MTDETPKRGSVSLSTPIGWIGTGVMGLSMCGHLLQKGYQLKVYSRTRDKARPLLSAGGTWAESPCQVAESSSIVFTMVGYPQDVREVYLGESGILQGARAGDILVDMTTTEPALSREIYEVARRKGVHALDAPVSGGDIGARNASLSIMVGGELETFEMVLPLLQAMGKNIVFHGAPGTGQHTKMCNQVVIAGTMIGVCEALLYGHQAGLDLEQTLRSIAGGAAGCWSLDNLAPRILKRDFNPGFFVEHFIKDMGIALKEAAAMGVVLPGLALVHQLYLAVKAQGHGKSGTQALMLALERLSGRRIERELKQSL